MASEMNIDKLNIEIEVNSKDGIAQLTKLSNTLKGLKGISNGLGNTSNGLNGISKNSLGAVKSISKLSAGFTRIATKGTVMLGTFKSISSGIWGLLDTSSEYTEVLNKLQVSMGGASNSAVSFAEKVNNLLGIDPSEWLDYQSTFGSMLKGFKIQEKDIQLMSQNLTQLAYDYSSLYNKSVQESFNKLNSGISGQIKGLKEYGSNVSVTAVNEMLRKKGIDATMKSLDASGQAYARYITIMENAKVTGVFNDMARTIDTTANRMRILESQCTQLKRAFGNIVNAVLGGILPVLNTLMAAIIKTVQFIGELFGFDAGSALKNDLSSVSNSAGDISNNVGDASKKLSDSTKKAKEFRKQLQGFDEINIIPAPDKDTSNKSSGNKNGSGTVSGNDIDWGELPQYNFLEGLENSINKDIDEWFKKLKIAISGGAYSTGLFLGQSLSDTFSNINWTKIQKSASTAGTKFAKFINGFLDGVNWSVMGNNVAQGFNTALAFLSSTVENFNFKKLGSSIAQYLSSALVNINWKKLGTTISNFFKGSLDTLITFVDEFDWLGVGKGIGEGLANIDYLGIAWKLFNLLTKALGGVLKGLAGYIGTAVHNPALIGLSAIASIKVINGVKPKVTTLLTKVSNFFKPIGTMIDKVLTSTSWGDGLINVWARVSDTLSTSGLSTKIGDLSSAILGVSSSSGSAQGALGKLGSAIGGLSLGGAIGIIGGLAGAVGLVTLAVQENKGNWEDLDDDMKNVVTQSQNISTSFSTMAEEVKTSLNGTSLKTYVDELRNLGTGVLKGSALEEAKVYISEINSKIPGAVKLTKDNRIEWQKTPTEIDKVTASLEKQAIQEAKANIVKKYIQDKVNLQTKYNTALNAQNKRLEEVKKYAKTSYEKLSEAQKMSYGSLNNYVEEVIRGDDKLNDLKDATNKVKESQNKLNGTYEDTLKSLDEIGNDRNVKVNIKADEKKAKKNTKNTIEKIQKTADKNPLNIKSKTEKPKKKNVDETIKNTQAIASKGKAISIVSSVAKATAKNLKNVKDDIEKNTKPTVEVKSKAEKGEVSKGTGKTLSANVGKGVIPQVMKSIAEKSEVSKSVGRVLNANVGKGISAHTMNSKPEDKDKSKNTGSKLKSNAQTGIGKGLQLKAYFDKTATKNTGKNFASIIKEGLKKITFAFSGVVDSVLGGAQKFVSNFKFLANGGLPSKGQMFIANEKGPELIGNIGGQSFVANQNQVMTMMSNALGVGISQAVQALSGGVSGTDKPVQITIQQVLDNKVVGQAFVKYHNGIVTQTGKSPLNV